MKAIIGARLLQSSAAQPSEKPFEIWDARLQGFVLRVQPSGARSYYAQVGRGRRIALGKVGELKPDEARDRCEKVLGNVAHGREPMHGLDGAPGGPTLAQFVADTYRPWLLANRPRDAQRSLQRIETDFADWLQKPLASITVEMLEDWRTKRLSDGATPQTAVRNLMALSGALTRAVRLGKLADNPVRRVERPRVDRTPKVRYLNPAEEKRLRTALRERDAEMRAARQSANQWRKARDREPMPTLPHYGDHLTPAALLSVNTGLRRGELLALKWSSVDLQRKILTVEGDTAKSEQTRHVPLNAEALDVLKKWRAQTPENERVIPVDTSMKKAWGALLQRAKITNFRWHDMRHHFASRLVQAGVPLNTVRELLGHGSLAMTLRYAHLAPDQKHEAVAKLVTR